MASRIYAAGIGRKHLRFGGAKLKVRVVGGGATKGLGRVLVNPADSDASESLFRPSLLETASETTADTLLLGSTFSAAFQSVAILGQFVGRGADAPRDLLDRVFPDTPSEAHYLAQRIKMQAAKNHMLVQQILQMSGSGVRVRTPTGAGGRSEGGGGSEEERGSEGEGEGEGGSEGADGVGADLEGEVGVDSDWFGWLRRLTDHFL